MSKPKAPKEDPSSIMLRERQLADLSSLDEEENRRFKLLLNAQRGTRMFRGSPLMRTRPANTAGAAGAGGAGGGSGGAASGGGAGGVRGGSRGSRIP